MCVLNKIWEGSLGNLDFFICFFFVVATYLLFLLIYFEVVRIELRASSLLGKLFPTESHLTHGRHHIVV